MSPSSSSFSSPSSVPPLRHNNNRGVVVVSWMTIYGLALVVVVLLTTYSDVFLVKGTAQQQRQRHIAAASASLSSSTTTVRTANNNLDRIPSSNEAGAEVSTNKDDARRNDNNSKDEKTSASSILEILSSRRNAFYQNNTLRSILQENPYCNGKEELLSILYAAATSSPTATTTKLYSRQDQPENVVQWLQYSCLKLAPWKQVTDLYGTKPIVVGMETCAAYRETILKAAKSSSSSLSSAPRVRVAGLYNSGTTALAHALVDNLPRTEASATAAGSALTARGQNSTITSPGVPWGKHLPLHYKYTNRHPADNPEDPDLVLPIVIVRDPYRWMQSMCKTAYDAHWTLQPQHCPNLVPTAHELKTLDASSFAMMSPNNSNSSKKKTAAATGYTYPVNVTYDMARYQHSDVYPSLADWWSEWVQAYIDSPSPRLLIRFEDLLFHAEHVMAKIVECAHGNENVVDDLQPYQYKLSKSKTHGKSPNFMEAIFKYARDDSKRSGGMTHQDLAYARGGGGDDGDDIIASNNNKTTSTAAAPLRAELLQLFHYHHPPTDAPLRIQYRVTNAGRK